MTLTLERCENVPTHFKTQVMSASTDECVLLYMDECCQGFAVQTVDKINLQSSHLLHSVASVSPCDDYKSSFPLRLEERFGDGLIETMIKVEEHHDTALYYNERTLNHTTARQSYAEFIDNVWSYTKYIYGNNFGPEGSTLVAFFHGGVSEKEVKPYSRSYFFKESSCRNVIHMTNSRTSAWAGIIDTRNSWQETTESGRKDEIVRAISTLVAWTAKGVYRNPAGTDEIMGKNVWPWSEIFIYDVYRGLGMTDDATRVFEHYWDTPYPYPSPRTMWFKNWFFPLYVEYGGARVLNNYFNLLSRHFPRKNVMEWMYERDMNFGEFVHFFSGAVGIDLRPMAKEAFKWEEWTEMQFQKAQRDFPRIHYLQAKWGF